jgi:hypothetical protein
MNTITNNAINYYKSNRVNNTNTSVQSVKDETSKSNTTVKNTTTVGDTVEISANKKAAFLKILNEVSSESEPVQLGNHKLSASAAFMTAIKNMNGPAWYSDSSSDSFPGYSDLIDNTKSFLSSNNDSSNNFINFCDKLKDSLSQYGII